MDIERVLKKMGEELYVDSTLKETLREKIRRREKTKKGIICVATAFAIFLLVLIPLRMSSPVFCAKDMTRIAEIDLISEGPESIAYLGEYKGGLLLCKTKGIFLLKDGVETEIVKGEFPGAVFNGKDKIAYLGWNRDKPCINIIELKTKTEETLYEFPSSEVFPSSVAFFPDAKRIVFSRGSSKVENNKLVVSYRNGISILNIEDRSVVSISDEGGYPTVSSNGRYIFYSVENEGIFRYDMRNKVTDKIITGNVRNIATSYGGELLAFVSWPQHEGEEASVSIINLKNRSLKVLLSSKSSTYYSLIFKDDLTLIVEKCDSIQGRDSSTFTLLQISLGREENTPEYIVSLFMKGILTRDDDFSRAFVDSVDIMSGFSLSNPHPTGFRIISVERSGNNYIVETEVFFSYTADAYFEKLICNFVVDGTSSIIKDIKRDTSKQVIYTPKDNAILIITTKGVNGKETTDRLVSPEIPQDGRISSLCYIEERDMLIYTIQSKDQFTVSSYDTISRTSKVLCAIEGAVEQITPGNDFIIISYRNKEGRQSFKIFQGEEEIDQESISQFQKTNEYEVYLPYVEGDTVFFPFYRGTANTRIFEFIRFTPDLD
ncbi:MAG: hypothetical protein KBG04_08105 [Bacteroidales bacterium]|nr:hypothetical protein [Bacteroidales bacterium]